ncbi:putative Radical-activating enzyme, radical SAM superfamily [Nitrospina gracilis 3/211]|uniref:7-carboxy-7-deazaguanine synthase n=1 Tax=Nitrospina gracilis (strain 3/211) TaxID=1266370 RepID=M1YYS5_NITG3|nr:MULTISPECIES: radical SAM protein [Nitrospina]MCF8723558.1 7-carboxy-7-deazaguanine synthase [Nitrospina sp. Nb-3]CCQ90631.1 putative Radical-activating enzyme, radical SAM superfamily [Nitrospina gracilis 3/211]
MLKVTEIFKSVQGESTRAGLPCLFVRLTGCNLRCRWCDTEYSFYGGKSMSLDEIIHALTPHKISLVEITGGEPLLQDEVYELMQALLDRDYTVMLETGGSLSLEHVPAAVIKIVDLKCPGSGEVMQNRYDNLDRLQPHDEVKFVIADRTDYEWSRDTLKKYNIDQKGQVLFSPVYDKLPLKDLTEWVLEDGLPVRVQTQLHKWIWGKDAIGV